MKLIVAGGRDFTDHEHMLKSLMSLDIPHDVELVSGMARGADITAFHIWKHLNLTIHEMPADWTTHGRSAGYIRNTEMAQLADALVAFWDGKSRGTAHMIQTMNKLNKPVHVFQY